MVSRFLPTTCSGTLTEQSDPCASPRVHRYVFDVKDDSEWDATQRPKRWVKSFGMIDALHIGNVRRCAFGHVARHTALALAPGHSCRMVVNCACGTVQMLC